jgi:3'-phosphoadenosine 5'-phosphosulfate sulfotransferase (PAPS reductase)/FAD synthetase
VCLHLLSESLDQLDVVWVRAGSVSPALEDLMRGVRSSVPSFVELNGDSDNWIKANGWPVSVVPVLHTNLGSAITDVGTRFAPFTSCCNDNKFLPIEDYVTRSGVECVITGQKKSDAIRNKAQEDMPGFIHPLADWTDADVLAYIDEHKLTYVDSHDCSNCTAYSQPETDEAKFALSELKSILSAEVEQLGKLGA